jgi:hypothetical protein
MGLQLVALSCRLEVVFGVKLRAGHVTKLYLRNDPPDIRVEDLFELLRSVIPGSGVLDLELDADDLWPTFQRAISDVLGVSIEEITKDNGLIQDLGASV